MACYTDVAYAIRLCNTDYDTYVAAGFCTVDVFELFWLPCLGDGA